MNINKDIASRITKIRDTFCSGSNTELASILGVSPQQVSNLCRGFRSAGPKTRQRIFEAFPTINDAWFFTGVGPMTKGEQTEVDRLKCEIELLHAIIANKDQLIAEQSKSLEDLRAILHTR